jgi:hypothetical protein
MEIKELAVELQGIYESIEDSRKRWYDHTRELIVTELNVVRESVILDWIVDINDCIQNHETITLAFRNAPCGLTYNDNNQFNQQEGRSGNLIKYGGTLNFSFVYLGEVMIWMTYPYIREILENTDNFVDFDRLKQDKITPEFIQDVVKKFLQHIIAWHAGKVGQEQRIGFSTPKTEE